MDKQQEYVLRTVEERDVRFIRLWFTDVLGLLKSVAITASELENAFEEGIGFDGSSIDGFARVQEADMLAVPDAATFQILPWRPESQGVARMFCDIVTPDGQPFAADPRQVLKRTLERAADMGFTFYVHPEMEFFLFEDANSTVPLDNGSYFDMTPLDVQQDFRRQAINMLERMGISVEYSHHEVAPSQHEIDLRYADALTMADNVMTFRLVVKETALHRGVYATFMPKPMEGQWGNAMHLHLSLFEGDTNAFHDPSDRYHLSPIAKKFTAGLLRHAREITAVTNQWVNSYKRLTARLHGPLPSGEAPVYISWGHSNRSALDPRAAVQAAQGRVEPHRVPGAGPGVQPLPGVRADPRGGPQGHRGGLRASRGGRGQHLRALARRAGGLGHRPAALEPRRGAAPDGGVRAGGRDAR
jgi:glutamine synthetase